MDEKTCPLCQRQFAKPETWSNYSWEKAKFCSRRCSNLGRWRGPDGDAYRVRLGAARRAWNEAHPEANRERVAKTAATRGMAFPALSPKKAGRSVAAGRLKMVECAKCGQPYEGDRSLHRHHIDGDTRNNALTNLIVLCPPCHRDRHRTEGTGIFAYHSSRGTQIKPRDCRVCGKSFRPSRNRQIICGRECALVYVAAIGRKYGGSHRKQEPD